MYCDAAGSRGGLAGVAGASSAQSLAATPALLSPRALDASDAAAGLLGSLGTSLGALSLSDQASLAGEPPPPPTHVQKVALPKNTCCDDAHTWPPHQYDVSKTLGAKVQPPKPLVLKFSLLYKGHGRHPSL